MDKSGLTASNVEFLDLPNFAASYPSASIPDRLCYIFWSVGQAYPGSVPGLILRINRMAFFWYHTLPTIDIQGSQKITPRDLIADYTAGVTDISGSGPIRSIKIRMIGGKAGVKTLVHETCHFYASNAFRDAVKRRKDGNELIGGAMISKILFEGFAEHFAQQVMQANPGFEADI